MLAPSISRAIWSQNSRRQRSIVSPPARRDRQGARQAYRPGQHRLHQDQLQTTIAPTITRRRCSFHSSARSASIKRLHERHAAGDFDTYTMVGPVGATGRSRTPNSSNGSDASFPASTRLSRRGLTGWATPTPSPAACLARNARNGSNCTSLPMARKPCAASDSNRWRIGEPRRRQCRKCVRHLHAPDSARRCGPPNPAEIWTSAGPARHWSSPI